MSHNSLYIIFPYATFSLAYDNTIDEQMINKSSKLRTVSNSLKGLTLDSRSPSTFHSVHRALSVLTSISSHLKLFIL